MRDERKDNTGGPERLSPARSFLEAVASLKENAFVGTVRAEALKASMEVWLVGGALRNLAMGSPPAPDFDFVTSGGDLMKLSGAVAAALQGSAFLLDKDAGAFRVVSAADAGPFSLDFSPVDTGILHDLGQRDFTVNSMAVSLDDIFSGSAPRVIDPCGGVSDAEARLLRVTSEGAFDSDPLRSLRAIRLSLQYGLKITGRTLELMGEKAALLQRTSPERRREELAAIFSCDGCSEAIGLIYSTGMMAAFFPEVLGWADVDGYGLLDHSLKTLSASEAVIREVSGLFPGHARGLEEHFRGMTGTVPAKTVFKLAAFLHDFGKPSCMSRADGRLRFIGHDSAGAVLVKEALLKLRFSRKAASDVALLVKNHHRVFNLASLSAPSVRAKAHFFRSVGGGAGLTLLCLALADARATRGSEDTGLLGVVRDLVGFYYGVYLRKKERALLGGKDIMRLFKVSEGPIVGEILKKVSEGVERGEIKSRREAVVFVRSWIESGGGK